MDYLSSVSDPLIADPDTLRWDDEADMVVVGFGGAGATAALQARELGGDVIALDRFGGGGATAFSGGVFYAGGTRYQSEAGFDDGADNMFAYLSQEECAVETGTLRRFCEGSAADIDWRSLQGVKAIGLTAGASAPEMLVNEVIDAFRARFDLTVEQVETVVEDIEFKVPKILREPA